MIVPTAPDGNCFFEATARAFVGLLHKSHDQNMTQQQRSAADSRLARAVAMIRSDVANVIVYASFSLSIVRYTANLTEDLLV